MFQKISLIILIIFTVSCTNSKEESEKKDTPVKRTDTEMNVITDSATRNEIQNDSLSEKAYIEQTQLKEWETHVSVFIDDPDGLPANVRKQPKGEIILQLPKPGEYEVWLKGEKDGWFFAEEIQEINKNEIHEHVNGYIHGSILAATTRNYGGEKWHLYKKSDENSDIVYSFRQETLVSLVKSNESGDWIKVKIKNENDIYTGWIQSEHLCGSLRTTCP